MDTEVLDRPTVPVTARPKTTADILEAAAMVIEEFGWIQGYLGSTTTGFCAMGALLHVADNAFMVARMVSEVTGPGPADSTKHPVAYFNDTPGRQQYEVTAALREAAKRARAVTTRSAQDGS